MEGIKGEKHNQQIGNRSSQETKLVAAGAKEKLDINHLQVERGATQNQLLNCCRRPTS